MTRPSPYDRSIIDLRRTRAELRQRIFNRLAAIESAALLPDPVKWRAVDAALEEVDAADNHLIEWLADVEGMMHERMTEAADAIVGVADVLRAPLPLDRRAVAEAE